MNDSIRDRLARWPWAEIDRALLDAGHARVANTLSPDECVGLAEAYPDERLFRSRVDMARHAFGVGEYKYFADPLPPLVAELRQCAYRGLAPIANRWMAGLGMETRYPAEIEDLRRLCAEQGQTKPTPLLLRYESGGYNCLHQDLYGDLVFPLQVAICLSPRSDYAGGEFLLVEQRPRAQSLGWALVLEQGEAVVFPTRFRPVAGRRGFHRCQVRHGVSRLRSGTRLTLGLIFHDAR